MSFKKRIQSLVTEYIQGSSIDNLLLWKREEKKELQALYNAGLVDDATIESALHTSVLRQAQDDFKTMTAPDRPYKIYPDHVGRPECLAYALKQGAFTQAQISRIPFDHGQTAETFPEIYGRERLISELRERLLDPAHPLEGLDMGDVDSDPHPVCDCC